MAEENNDGNDNKKDSKRLKTTPSVFSDLDEDDTPHFSSLQTQGNVYASNGEFSKALTCFDSALRLIESNNIYGQANLHELRAQVLLAIDEDFRAILAAKEATNLRPDWGDGWLTLGRAQLNLGEPSMAIESFEKVLKIDPNNIEAQEDYQNAKQVEEKFLLMNVDGRAIAAAARNIESVKRTSTTN